MIQFNKNEVQKLHEKLAIDNSIIVWLETQNQIVLNHDILVPKTGLATWNLYYFCPEHSVRLRFDFTQPEKHICPVDGQVFSGEPYNGAWWVAVNENNARACYHLGLLWLLTANPIYLAKAKTILYEYATNYCNYEVHGNIPHNQPGKAFSQTMSDAVWIRQLALGYDLIKAELSLAEQRRIEEDLLIPGAEFLMGKRLNQIHNHEVIISSAIAIIGIIIGHQDMVEFAIYSKYGLLYQLHNGVLEDGAWFEGSLHYQFYALESFLVFEKFARHSKYSQINQPTYHQLLRFPFKVIQPDGGFPLINDDILKPEPRDLTGIYEFGYRVFGDNEFAWLLGKFYETNPRNNVEAFFYGVDELPDVKTISLTDYHPLHGSGLSVFRGADQRYLLVKHSPFGGEHDHYDRLGIAWMAFGDRIAVDFGTTGYGAALHYNYYKNTGTHNTVMINEENQPPANPIVLQNEQTNNTNLLDVLVQWDGRCDLPDSHTLVEWDDQSYAGVTMRRTIQWHERYFIEMFQVDGVQNKTIDWVLHVSGMMQPNSAFAGYIGEFSHKKPFKYLKNIHSCEGLGQLKITWNIKHCDFHLFSYVPSGTNVYSGSGPDNPSVQDISYLIQRISGNNGLFINVFEATPQGCSGIENVNFSVESQQVKITIFENGVQNEYIIRR